MYITDENDIEILRDLILSKKYFRNRGKNITGFCNQFESSFAEKIGVKHSLMVTSGTNALICALSSLDLSEGDEVIIPSFTFFATAAAVIHSKATPVIVNIDYSLMIDPIEVEKAVTKKTKAIIAVHMDGHPCDMNALKKIAAVHNLVLIEDVAQACGGSYQGARLGSIGELGCFSFNVDKIISCGEGGALVTNNRKYFEKSLCIQDACCSFGPTFKESFIEIQPFVGQSMRVSEISGALMSVQLTRLDFILNGLRERKEIFIDVLKRNRIDTVPSHDETGDCATSIYLSFPSVQDAKENLLKLVKEQIVAIPITIRPAHACWQWMHLLEKERPNGNYKKTSFLSSIDLLMSTLKINIPYEMGLNEVEEYAKKISQVINR
ncbi:MAG: aminotransferase class I/II-fold pyridoxal phosphate-dependent enzyme [Bacteriovorax sp.]|nr:aminotransferase class I/II-fold pyridoxal phosphate-dependent enzyme [Bacteriovorax sp.]